MTEDQAKVVVALLDKASAAETANEALNFSQAACNAANALRGMAEIKRVDQPQK